MNKLDRLCRILLDEQDLLKKRETLSKEKLAEFNRIWDDINQDHEDAKSLRIIFRGLDVKDYQSVLSKFMQLYNESKKDRQIVKFVRGHIRIDQLPHPTGEELQKILEGKK